MASTSIAIVGGGSVATSLAYHLIEALAEVDAPPICGPSVTIFEPAQRIGRGSAYADDLESNLLNVTVGGMSVAGNDKLHFSRWLKSQGIASFRGLRIHDGSYVSRALFGQYLESVYEDVARRARALGVTMRHVQAQVTSIEQGAGSVFTLRSDKTEMQVQYVALCIGNLDSPAFSHLGCYKEFHASPYPVLRLVERVHRDATVCVLGTSLSAIDAIVGLAAGGHRGKIVAVSRSGRLPSVRSLLSRPVQFPQDFKDKLVGMKRSGEQLTLESLIAMVTHALADTVKEWSGESITKLAGPTSCATAFLEDEIRLATSAPRQWQSFGAALNDMIDLLWHLLPEWERDRFNANLRSTLMVRKAAFPLENAQLLLQLVNGGRLEVLGGFEAVGYDAGRGAFRIDTLDRTEGEAPAKRHLYADCLVNATSYSADAESTTMPLLRSLIASGAAVADRFGGLKLDYDTGCAIDAKGAINHRMSVLGTMASGTYFWTNAMDVNARLAMGQARRLAKALH